MRLLALEGTLAGRDLAVAGAIILGRDPACGIVLNDDQVSPRHCALQPLPDGFAVDDLGSRNGTLVNGQPITRRTQLREGDLLVVGRSMFEVRDLAARPTAVRAEPPDAPAPPQPRPSSARPAQSSLTRLLGDAEGTGRAFEARLRSLLQSLSRSPGLSPALGSATSVDLAEVERLLSLVSAAQARAVLHPSQLLTSEAASLHAVVASAVRLLIELGRIS